MTALCGYIPATVLAEEVPIEIGGDGSIFDVLNPAHDFWSDMVADYSGRLDRFFGDDRNFEETNKSMVQLDFTQLIDEGGEHRTTFSGRAKLALPQAQKRLHLLLETDPEDVATSAINPEGPVPTSEIASPDSYAAALRYRKEREDRWDFSTDIGIRFRSGLDPYTRLRGSGALPLGFWRFKLTETLFWFRTIGPGETTRLDIERPLPAELLFRSATHATWLNDDRSFTVRQDLSIYQTLDARRALLYMISGLGTTQPVTQMEEYVVLLRYRPRLHHDWLFGEISPQVHYPVETDYHPDLRLVLGLEMLFGNANRR
ncbi:MAG: hypothetical protein IT488_05250 [Gammaproteobacteria bacterium]|nr:hypothetical protein [Gammaproteobacteria bacterium]